MRDFSRAAHASLALFCILPLAAEAQLVDITQTTPGVPGGAIAKSLTDEIGSGRGDVNMEWSSGYLIARDPARAIRRGRQLFQRKFTRGSGPGAARDPATRAATS